MLRRLRLPAMCKQSQWAAPWLSHRCHGSPPQSVCSLPVLLWTLPWRENTNLQNLSCYMSILTANTRSIATIGQDDVTSTCTSWGHGQTVNNNNGNWLEPLNQSKLRTGELTALTDKEIMIFFTVARTTHRPWRSHHNLKSVLEAMSTAQQQCGRR